LIWKDLRRPGARKHENSDICCSKAQECRSLEISVAQGFPDVLVVAVGEMGCCRQGLGKAPVRPGSLIALRALEIERCQYTCFEGLTGRTFVQKFLKKSTESAGLLMRAGSHIFGSLKKVALN